MTTSTRTRTTGRRAARAERLEALHRQQQRADRRRRLVKGGGLATVVALLAAILVAAATAGSEPVRTSTGPLVTPRGLAASGAMAVGDPDAATTVSIWFDPMCPACAQFEQVHHADLDRLVAAGEVRVELHPMSFLDPRSQGTRYSTRAGNALATVADASPEHVWDLYGALYAAQPAEGTPGLSDDAIADLATEAGVPQQVVDRFAERTFEAWIAQRNQDAFDAGVTSTPTVLVDGERVTDGLFVPGRLADVIADAR